jgi:glycosyltransferase involved in cell wall biosynthesis
MLAGKPVIATNLGGIHDWLPRETYYPLNYKEVNVFNMGWAPWYRENQGWADISVDELRQKLRYVYDHQNEAKDIGDWGRKYVRQNFSYEAVGRMMKDRLLDIQKMIDEERGKGIRWLER